MPNAGLLWVAGDSLLIQGVILAGREFHIEVDRRVRLRRLPRGANEREPSGDMLPRGDPRGRDFGSADCVSAEEVVVFDVNIELSDRMSQRDNEMLVPLGILGVFQDACASHGGLGEANGDVGIAGDDLTVAADFGVLFFSSSLCGRLARLTG